VKDESLLVRHTVIHAMMRLRVEARAAVPALVEAVRDPSNAVNAGAFNHTVAEGAASALGPLSAGTPDAVDALEEFIGPGTPDVVRAAACRSVGAVGVPAKRLAPKLLTLQLRNDEYRFTREEAHHALVALGENPPPLESLVEWLKRTGKYREQSGPVGRPNAGPAPPQPGVLRTGPVAIPAPPTPSSKK
jgi:HEAT repeat protein